jgi:hypothetical protein
VAGSGIKAPDLLSIGIGTGGMSPANYLVEEALAGFMRLVIHERAAYPNEGLRINIVFHLPGPMFQPDYEGVHATRLDRKNQQLLIVAAVPSNVRFDEVSNYCADVLREARLAAADYLSKRHIGIAIDNVNALINHLIGQIKADSSRS